MCSWESCHPAAMQVITQGRAGSLLRESGCSSAKGAQGQLPWATVLWFLGAPLLLPYFIIAEQGNSAVQSTTKPL